MKAILISIKPEWVAKILNGEKTIEIRKTAPKCELPVDVYIYCTKQGKRGDLFFGKKRGFYTKPLYDDDEAYEYAIGLKPLNGKVVAKFTLREVEKLTKRKIWGEWEAYGEHTDFIELDRKTCLTQDQIIDYMGRNYHAYGWRISDLEIFDNPKELDEFEYPCPSGTRYVGKRLLNGLPSKKHPPQSWCYVEEK